MEDTAELVRLATHGDASARQQLLSRHRSRLTRMVELRMDPRVAPRFDPSDVVQEALVTAEARLDDYLHNPPVAFYPWLRRIAWERLVKTHRLHLHTQQRTVMREEIDEFAMSHESVELLVNRIADKLPTPSDNMVRSEIRRRVHSAIEQLKPHEREVIELLYLEQMKTNEAAETLDVSAGSIRVRHFRALQRLSRLLKDTDNP